MYLGYCAPHLRLPFKLNSFSSLTLFSPGIRNGRKRKLTKNYMYINRLFKDVMYLFCCQDYLKIFLENYRFIKNLGMMHIVGGVGSSCYSRQKFLTKKLSSCLPTLDGCFFLKYGFRSYSFTPVD